jgi:hypothetical protein
MRSLAHGAEGDVELATLPSGSGSLLVIAADGAPPPPPRSSRGWSWKVYPTPCGIRSSRQRVRARCRDQALRHPTLDVVEPVVELATIKLDGRPQ